MAFLNERIGVQFVWELEKKKKSCTANPIFAFFFSSQWMLWSNFLQFRTLQRRLVLKAKKVEWDDGVRYFFHSEMLLSHSCYQTTHVPELSILKTHHKSQIPTPPTLKICSLLSILFFGGGFSRFCFENWEIFGVKSVEFFENFLRVDLES